MKVNQNIEKIITRWHMYVTSLNADGKIDYDTMEFAHDLLENKLEPELKAVLGGKK